VIKNNENKMIKKILLSLCLSLSITLINALPTAQAQDFNNGQWVDLTHAFDEDAIYWPTADSFKKTTVYEGQTDGGYFYSAYNFSATEHGGTHLDSPVHFSKGQMTVDQVPIEQLIGKAVVIDISKQAQKDRNYQLSVADIKSFENVANLDQLPATGATVIALPMKIKGGSGGPLRIVAFVTHK
jgi:kynurenine formamidase